MRRSLAVLIVGLGGVAASAATAGAQAPGTAGSYVTEMPSVSSFDAQRGALPTTGAQPRLGAQIDKPGSGAPGSASPRGSVPTGRLRAACHRHPGSRRVRCVVKQRRRVIERCTFARHVAKRAAARRCLRRARTAGSSTLGGVRGHTTALQWHGFPGQTMPAVGKLVWEMGGGRWSVCSGTVVSRSVMLTAGHCLTGDGKPEVGWFAPGATASSGADQFQNIYAPYGWWQLRRSRSWVPTAWGQSRDYGKDWGLAEILPDASGRLIGDVVGAWTITPNIRWGVGANAFLVGYAATGWWSDTTAGLRGRGQYACNALWDGEWQASGSGYDLSVRCPMNGGASGGPWFVRLDDGTWTIGGVNSRCQTFDATNRPNCSPYGDKLITSYMNDGMLEFWNSVAPALRYG